MADTNITRNLRTVDEWKAYFKTKIPLINPNWTNTSDEDLGMVLVTLISIIGDQLNFRYDTSILEAFLGSARERSNVQALLNLIGYSLDTYQTGKTTVSIDYPDEMTHSTSMFIPKFSYVTNILNSIKYYNLTDLTIPPYAAGVVADFYEGVYYSDLKTCNFIDDYGRLYLTRTNSSIAANTVVVTYNGTEMLTRVDDIYLSTAGRQFQLLVDNYGNNYVQLDASWKDYINRSAGTNILVEYLATSGVTGAVGVGTLVRLKMNSGSTSWDRVVTVTNINQSAGYREPESIETARALAPRYARTMRTAITTSDYEDLIVTSDSVYLDAKVIDLNYQIANPAFDPEEPVSELNPRTMINPLGLEPYQLIIVVLTNSEDTETVEDDELILLSSGQKTELRLLLDEVRMATIQYELTGPIINPVNVFLTVAVESDPSLNETVSENVMQLINTYFSTLMIGKDFHLSKLLTFIHNNYPLGGLSYVLPTNLLGNTVNTQVCTNLQVLRSGLSTSVEVINV